MQMTSLKSLKLALSMGALALLSACGGGGDDDVQACSSASALVVNFQYSSPGISAGTASVVLYQPGVAFSNTPVITGVPESCNASKRFTVKAQPSFSGVPINLPSSVSLDPVTGTFSGTLAVPVGSCTQAGVTTVNSTNPPCNGTGTFEKAFFDVTFTLPGYSPLTKSVQFTPPL